MPETERDPSILIPPAPTIRPFVIYASFATVRFSLAFKLLTMRAPILALGASIPPISIIRNASEVKLPTYAYFPET